MAGLVESAAAVKVVDDELLRRTLPRGGTASGEDLKPRQLPQPQLLHMQQAYTSGQDDQLMGTAALGAPIGGSAYLGELPDAAQALQASAAAVRASVAQAAATQVQAPGSAPRAHPGAHGLAPRAGGSGASVLAGGEQVEPLLLPGAARTGVPGVRGLPAGAGLPGVAGVDPHDHAYAAAGAGGIPSMDVVVRYKRSWSIQEALDQHSTLCRQKEILAKIGANRVRVRRSQLQFAQLEVEDAVERARRATPQDAANAARTQALAGSVRRVTQDLALAARLRRVDETMVRQHLAIAEAEIEKSRLEMKVMKQAIDDKSLVVATDDATPSLPVTAASEREYFYCTNCKVGGHGQRFCEYLLKRREWRVYPYQKWFEDEKHNEYHCPLGKRLVDFADESHFSRIAMYIKGRIWLEDKTKMWELVPDLMPDTYVIEDLKWRDGRAPQEDGSDLPWFVKEADRNWGTSVQVCQKASECMDLAKPGAMYVVQQHIRDPLLMDDGRKCHIKFYVLLMGLEDAVTWQLYTFKDGYLSISPNSWSPTDLSKETQVTIIRSERIGEWAHWPQVYPKCKAGVAEVVRRGVAQGKLEGRAGKRQFEILSSDFIVDTHGDVWLFEFNMSPVLKDPQDSPQTHDADMITAALEIVVPRADGVGPGDWDFAGEFIGVPPTTTEKKQPVTAAATAARAPQDAPADASGEVLPGPGVASNVVHQP